jgi:hypothetical protein
MGGAPRLKRTGAFGAAVLAGIAGPATAQPYGGYPRAYPPPQPYVAQPNRYWPPQPYAPPSDGCSPEQPYCTPGDQRPAGGAPAAYASPPPCCLAPAGSLVAVRLTDRIVAGKAQPGDALAIRLAAPLIVDGQVVLPAGTPGLGRVVQSSGPGLGGKGAKLVVSADFLTVQGGRVPLQGMQLTGTGRDHSLAADLASLGGWISMPLGFVGFVVTGGDIEIPAGTAAAAKLAQSVSLRPLRAAGREDYDQVRAVFGDPPVSDGYVKVSPPPPGMGQVVFFRQRSLAGAGLWFNVREHGQALGKLTNGAWFTVRLPPGLHSFTAVSEPEFKDALTLKIDPGETYYVEGLMTHGVAIGVADLTPSDKARFDALTSPRNP